ncbi:MAG: heptaprenyl diphosphate synthase [Clostridiales bacterium GWF2_38_85]|nr:MAG: heptaprenyl diphosphate synthase [Clostridiales bacterium GWF2_38_85]HBL84617.1 heptaprenyl diphosphate synthase [Clostridiales bacterium]
MKDANFINKKYNSILIKKLALTGLLFALAIVLAILEGMFPMPIPVPGVKLGLSNIVVMYSLFFLKRRNAIAIAVLKGFFVFITRGPVSGALSICGGLLSILIMIILMLIFKDKLSYLIVSVSGAIFHNIGQFIVASFIMSTPLWFYFPILLLSGLIAGFATSILLKITLPAFERLHLR